MKLVDRKYSIGIIGEFMKLIQGLGPGQIVHLFIESGCNDIDLHSSFEIFPSILMHKRMGRYFITITEEENCGDDRVTAVIYQNRIDGYWYWFFDGYAKQTMGPLQSSYDAADSLDYAIAQLIDTNEPCWDNISSGRRR